MYENFFIIIFGDSVSCVPGAAEPQGLVQSPRPARGALSQIIDSVIDKHRVQAEPDSDTRAICLDRVRSQHPASADSRTDQT